MQSLKTAACLLFTPADKPERFDKAKQVNAHGLIIDLEDSISLANKLQARSNAVNYLKTPKKPNEPLRLLRINNLATAAGLEDILSLRNQDLNIDAVVYPKAESAFELNLLSEHLAGEIALIGTIETALAVQNLHDIVANTGQLQGLAFGAADYATDIGCDLTQMSLQMVRSQIVTAAASRKLACFDAPCFDFNDADLLKREATSAREIGFTGKLAIHPLQVGPVQKFFCPDKSSYEKALTIARLFHDAKGDACQYQGQMIDKPVYDRAQRIIALYEANCQTEEPE